MEPNKLETQIKNKLNSREIQPTAHAWDRLDAMLGVTERKPAKSKINWFAIAAIFVGFTVISFVFFNQKQSKNEIKNEVVLENPKIEISKPETLKPKSEVSNPILNPKQVVQSSKTYKNNRQPFINNIPQKNQNQGVSIINHNQNQIVPSSNTENNVFVYEEPSSSQVVLNTKVTDANIETLLASLEGKSNLQKSTLKINPTSLLNQVDGELTQTFREKVISQVSRNFQTVKVAVVNRNQQ